MNMKYILVISTFLLLPFAGAFGQQTVAEELAARLAQKMKDTLSLSATQQSELYLLNLQLHTQKMNVRQQYAASPDSVGLLIQCVENTRDSLYRNVLLNEEKYQLYRVKKKELINNN